MYLVNHGFTVSDSLTHSLDDDSLSQVPSPSDSHFGECLKHWHSQLWGFPATKGLFRKFWYSFSSDNFNEIKDDERYKDNRYSV